MNVSKSTHVRPGLITPFQEEHPRKELHLHHRVLPRAVLPQVEFECKTCRLFIIFEIHALEPNPVTPGVILG
jgi:hypothetical protein